MQKKILIRFGAHLNILQMTYPRHRAILAGGGLPPTFKEGGPGQCSPPLRWRRPWDKRIVLTEVPNDLTLSVGRLTRDLFLRPDPCVFASPRWSISRPADLPAWPIAPLPPPPPRVAVPPTPPLPTAVRRVCEAFAAPGSLITPPPPSTTDQERPSSLNLVLIK